jgi:hypothetical protein
VGDRPDAVDPLRDPAHLALDLSAGARELVPRCQVLVGLGIDVDEHLGDPSTPSTHELPNPLADLVAVGDGRRGVDLQIDNGQVRAYRARVNVSFKYRGGD